MRTVSADSYDTAGRDYRLELRHRSETWIPRSEAEPQWLISESEGLRGVTPVDEAAWRRDGSPTAFAEKCRIVPKGCKPIRPVPPTASQRPKWAGVTQLGNRDYVTLAQLQKLPADPGRLRKVVLGRLTGVNAKIDVNIVVFEIGSQLITDLPVTPEVRSAAYRMMAALPGVHAQRSVRDAHGRPGVAVSMAKEDGGLEQRLIIDPETGMALANELLRVKARSGEDPAARGTGERMFYELVETVGWTDEQPRLPERRARSSRVPAPKGVRPST